MAESQVVPFRMPDYHREHPSCPYTSGCPYDGSHHVTRRMMPFADEEPSAASPKSIDPENRHTLEIRPGELPWSWLRRPF